MSAAVLVLLVSTTALAQPSRRSLDGTSLSLGAGQKRPQTRAVDQRTQPWHDPIVAIISERGFACSGVLVHRRAVLTAQHCKSGRHVMFGSNTNEPGPSVRVVGFVAAPNKAIDMALMILESDAPIAPYGLHRALEPPRDVRVVGFGCQSPGGCDGAGRRSYFDARITAAHWGCEPALAATLSCLPSSEMVLPRSIGADTCTGDSGGAVLARALDGWHVVAITSRGVRGAVLPCGDGGVYVRVQPQLGWITKELEKLS